MAYVMLKGTSNPKFQDLVGQVGELYILDNGRFMFEFVDRDGDRKTLSSGVKGRLGELNDESSKEVNIVTGNSIYNFAKVEHCLEESKLFGHDFGVSLEARIAEAAGMAGPAKDAPESGMPSLER